jgi:hypothetical protein
MTLNSLKKAAISFGIMLGVVLVFSAMPVAFAQVTAEAPSSILNQTGGEGNIKNFVNNIINFILGFLGFLCVIFIIYAGFLYVTSQGADDQIGTAKNIILYCAIGVVIIFASYAIVNTVLQAPTGVAPTTGSGTTTTP